MVNKIAIAVICGGCSTEHEISIQSAKNIVSSLDKEKYDLQIIYVNQRGEWHRLIQASSFLQHHPLELIASNKTEYVTPLLGASQPTLMCVDQPETKYMIDCFFPMIHGTQGEDGCLQGLLEMMQVAYVGANVLSSAISMNKDITKQILESNGVNTVPWQMLQQEDVRDGLYERLEQSLDCDLFIKPANLGSSVGISKVHNEAEFVKALQNAFKYDEYVIVEKAIQGREIECAVIGNEEPIASLPGEIITNDEFYSYNAKYVDANSTKTVVPADIPEISANEIRSIAVETFKILQGRGMLRVDFFLQENGLIFVNEVNTIPGFTNISLYPTMWQASGTSYHELLDNLIFLAMQRHAKSQQLSRVYSPIAQDNRMDTTRQT